MTTTTPLEIPSGSNAGTTTSRTTPTGVAQVIALEHPELVRRVILAGTGPRGGGGIEKMPLIAGRAYTKAALTLRDPALPLLQPQRTRHARRVGVHGRLEERTGDRDKRISMRARIAQLEGDPRGSVGRRRPLL